MAQSIHDISMKTLTGDELRLADHRGRVLLLVNTASRCGFTPQYAGLERLHRDYGPQGLTVIGFPCNQFGQQEPGDASEIANFCQENYGVSFALSEKIDVNGENAHPLFRLLKHAAPGVLGTEGIKWNFTKFLVDRDGRVVDRYGSNEPPEKLGKEIERLLAAPKQT